MKPLKRIALYGGTFDPVHVGHLAIAEKILTLFALDEVLFIPAHVAPHKRERAISPPLQRYAMLALATQNESRFRVSTIELDAPEKPYTVDTLARLREMFGHQARLFFVMGADSWMEITTWREWERVLGLTDHIVVTRPGHELSVEHLNDEIGARIVNVRGVSREEIEKALDAQREHTKIYLTDAVMLDVSATTIRCAVAASKEVIDEDLRALVPPSVADYIKKYGLYRNAHETDD
jgi:nicotinate-nucleotide adenylyltransferase